MRTQTSRISVLLVDDHRMVREGMSALLQRQPDIEIAGAAENGLEALELAEELEPDVMVLDLTMPKMNGYEVLRHLSEWRKAPAVVVCSMHGSVLASTLALGASAYVEKRAAAETLVETIREVAGQKNGGSG